MTLNPKIPSLTRRTSSGSFHDYVRSVFADCSVRARLLRASRARWLHRLSGVSPHADQNPSPRD